MIDLERLNELKKPEYKQEWRVYLSALHYIENGIYVLPIRPNQKLLPPKETRINYGAASRKREVIDKWFHPEVGKFKGWNIGIACGKEGGVWALDADRHGATDGVSELEEICRDASGSLAGPSAITPSGGRHYLFAWQENALSSTGKIGKAIDSRGGTTNACKGHIVAFPSVIEGNHYEWLTGGEIPNIPSWLMTRLGVPWRSPAESNKDRGNENIGEDDEEVRLDLEQIERMLEFIDPDDLSYEEWLHVGQAINSQHPDDNGLRLWDEWSSRGERYKPNECHIRWSGFDPTGPIRVGTLFFYAKERGWTARPDDAEISKWDELVENINHQYAMVMVGGKIRILREKTTVEDPLMGRFDLLTKEDFRILHANKLHYISNGSKTAVRSEADIWLAHQNRRTFENGLGLFPNGAPSGWYNTWQGFSVVAKPGNWDNMKSHIYYVICNGNQEHCDWVMDWMADAVQDPANPKGCAVVMKGEEGTGKGTLADSFGRLFGGHYRHLIDDAHLTGNFNAHMMDAVFVFADEITWGGNKKSAGKLKGMVTEKYVIGERKGVDAVSYRNMIHMMIASNEDWVVPAGPQSRRWFITNVSNKHRNDRNYFKSIYNQMENGGYEAMLYDLMDREITSNLNRAPETEELTVQRVMGQSHDSIVQWWTAQLANGILDVPSEGNYDEQSDWPEIVDRMALHESYKQWCTENRMNHVSAIIFNRRMKEVGMKPTRPTSTNGQARKYKYIVPDYDASITSLKSVFGVDLRKELGL